MKNFKLILFVFFLNQPILSICQEIRLIEEGDKDQKRIPADKETEEKTPSNTEPPTMLNDKKSYAKTRRSDRKKLDWTLNNIGIELFAPVFGVSYNHNLINNYLSLSFLFSSNINHGAHQQSNLGSGSTGIRTYHPNYPLLSSQSNDYYLRTDFNTLNSKLAFHLNTFLLSPSRKWRPYISVGLGIANVHVKQGNVRYDYHSEPPPSSYERVNYTRTYYRTEANEAAYVREIGMGLARVISPKIKLKIGLRLFQAIYSTNSPVYEVYDKTGAYKSVGGEKVRNIADGYFLPVSVHYSF